MVPKETMDPPFATRWQAVCFLLLLVILLTLPILVTRFRLVLKSDVYSGVTTRHGPFTYLQQQIFSERSELDIVFVGSSLIWAGIDTPYVQRELSKKLGREAKVVTLATNWRGEDLTYTVLSDLLAHRKVRMVVLTMPLPYQTQSAPHHQAFRWWLYGDNEAELRRLPLKDRVAVYGEQVLGAPRHLLSAIRSNRIVAAPLDRKLGALQEESGFQGAPFVRRTYQAPPPEARGLIYSPETRNQFEFTGQALSQYQSEFLSATFMLLSKHQTRVLILHVPTSQERHSAVVSERMFWPAVMGQDVPILGVTPATLFAGMSDAEIDQFFYDEHLNVNGSELFTRTVTPGILEVYGQQTTR
jgi:hypothetical protein